ncbi:IS256 family transposase [Limnohabitans sp.]|jgi:transposase-like protein|uniref:IS256 family transposase n=1 Tax=Limnohabitans sp. TaxID=1907725 RepID=UPI0037C041F9
MAQRTQLDDTNNPLHEAYACLLANGLDGAGQALRILVNEASRIERAQHLQATPYERSAQRVDHANGYKSKTVLTRLGELTFEVPQVRSGGFYPSALERGSRSEQAMNLALAEMYVQGVSTRKVITVLQKLVGPEIAISSTQISRCTALLDEGLNAWRTRPLDETPYVIARYERVRHANQVVDCAVLVAIGITTTGHRRVLGVSVALSEAEVHWRAFLDSLIGRGLRGVKYIASDDHAGLKAARKAMFLGVPWQRCQFHLQHNAQGYVTKLDQRTTVARQIRAIFNAGDAHEAQRLLNVALKDWQGSHPQLAAWAETNVPEGFAVFNLPEGHRVRMRTTNGLERLNKELKRRTRVATLFPNPQSCERLVSALLAEQDEEWMSGKIYLNMKP